MRCRAMAKARVRRKERCGRRLNKLLQSTKAYFMVLFAAVLRLNRLLDSKSDIKFMNKLKLGPECIFLHAHPEFRDIHSCPASEMDLKADAETDQCG